MPVAYSAMSVSMRIAWLGIENNDYLICLLSCVILKNLSETWTGG